MSLTPTQKQIVLFLYTQGPAYIWPGHRYTKTGHDYTGDAIVLTSQQVDILKIARPLDPNARPQNTKWELRRDEPSVARYINRTIGG